MLWLIVVFVIGIVIGVIFGDRFIDYILGRAEKGFLLPSPRDCRSVLSSGYYSDGHWIKKAPTSSLESCKEDQ